MKKLFLYSLSLMVSLSVFSQNTITVKVSDKKTKEPLVGSTISSQKKKHQTTGKNGMVTLDCPVPGPITVSFAGYETTTFDLKNCEDTVYLYLAADKTVLNAVEITATSSGDKSLLSQPASIVKLTGRELKRGNGLFLDDAINSNVPGVTMNRRAVASGQQFNIRGYGNGARGTNGVSSNFDGQGYKVYVNGIPVTDAEGITVMDDIDFGSIGNVEVIKGPSGSLYGLAVAGVVNLKTIQPVKGKTSIGQEIMTGSYGLQRYTTSFQMGKENASLLISYGKQKSDGYMAHTRSEKDFIHIAGEFQPNEKQNISVYFGYSNSYDQRGGELTIDQFNKGDYSGNPFYIKNNAHSGIVSFRAGFAHTYRFTGQISNTTSVFGSGINSHASSAGGWTDKTPVNFGLRSTFDTKFPVGKGVLLSGITGVETQHQYAQITSYAMVKNPSDTIGYNIPGPLRSNQVITTRTTSVFSEWTLAFPHRFSLTAGIGVSSMGILLDNRFYEAGSLKPTQYRSSYNNLWSPRVAVNKLFSEKIAVYAAYSKGYKAPVSSYFYIPYTGEINKDLKPETGAQFEVGTKGSVVDGKLNYELAAFYTKFTRKMTAVSVPNPENTATLYSYMVNGGGQHNKGLEASLKYLAYQSATGFFSAIRPFANMAYSDFTYKDFRIQKSITLTEDYSNKPVAGVARFTGNAGVDVSFKYGLYANIVYSYKDAVPITSDGLNKASGFSLLNAKSGIIRSLSAHFDMEAYFGVNNITGVPYYYMVFVNQLPDAYLPAPNKANYFGGINLKYNF